MSKTMFENPVDSHSQKGQYTIISEKRPDRLSY